MQTIPYTTDEGIIELVRKDEHDAIVAELIERLREAREAHLHAAARDVQTIQQQSVLLDRLSEVLRYLSVMPEYDQDDAHRLRNLAKNALAAYKSAKTGDHP